MKKAKRSSILRTAWKLMKRDIVPSLVLTTIIVVLFLLMIGAHGRQIH